MKFVITRFEIAATLSLIAWIGTGSSAMAAKRETMTCREVSAAIVVNNHRLEHAYEARTHYTDAIKDAKWEWLGLGRFFGENKELIGGWEKILAGIEESRDASALENEWLEDRLQKYCSVSDADQIVLSASDRPWSKYSDPTPPSGPIFSATSSTPSLSAGQ